MVLGPPFDQSAWSGGTSAWLNVITPSQRAVSVLSMFHGSFTALTDGRPVASPLTEELQCASGPAAAAFGS